MAQKLSRSQQQALSVFDHLGIGAWGGKRPPNVGGFTPYVAPTTPPPGTYDPSLDAQLAAAGRGFGDLQTQTGIDNQRAQDDFNLQSGHFQQQLQQSLADLSLGHTRNEDAYHQAITNLTRGYDRLGTSQLEGAAGSGMLRGGALEQSQQKRDANMAIDRQPLDTTEQQQTADYNTNVQRANQGYQFDVGNLGLGLSRGNEDRANQLGIAGRENAQFGTDVGAQRWFQATMMGYDPPQKPAGLQTDAQGRQYKLVQTPRGVRRLMSTGVLLSR